MSTVRLGAVDVGTNSTRLLVGDVVDGVMVAEHAREMVITRLGKGVDRTGRFDPAALARTLEVLAGYAATCRRLGVARRRLVATSATRDAADRRAFLDGVRDLLGVDAEVCRRLGVERRRVVATSATRDAADRQVFLAGVRELLGVEAEVLTGQAEAAAT